MTKQTLFHGTSGGRAARIADQQAYDAPKRRRHYEEGAGPYDRLYCARHISEAVYYSLFPEHGDRGIPALLSPEDARRKGDRYYREPMYAGVVVVQADERDTWPDEEWLGKWLWAHQHPREAADRSVPRALRPDLYRRVCAAVGPASDTPADLYEDEPFTTSARIGKRVLVQIVESDPALLRALARIAPSVSVGAFTVTEVRVFRVDWGSGGADMTVVTDAPGAPWNISIPDDPVDALSFVRDHTIRLF